MPVSDFFFKNATCNPWLLSSSFHVILLNVVFNKCDFHYLYFKASGSLLDKLFAPSKCKADAKEPWSYRGDNGKNFCIYLSTVHRNVNPTLFCYQIAVSVTIVDIQ